MKPKRKKEGFIWSVVWEKEIRSKRIKKIKHKLINK
jgi:hypothetical protein